MKYRTTAYLNRKKAAKDMACATDLKSLLKAEFFATSNILVKKDVLKAYQQLTGSTKVAVNAV